MSIYVQSVRCKRRRKGNERALLLIILVALSSCLGTRTFAIRQFGKRSKANYVEATSSRSPLVDYFVAYEAKSKHYNMMVGSNFNRVLKIVIPPLLLFLLSVSSCDASVLNSQPIAIRGPFFQGWLLRTVDHRNSRSFIVIVGSFSSKGSKRFDEHYVFCGVSTKDEGIVNYEAFPEPNTVTITGSSPSLPSILANFRPSFKQNTNITWTAENIGYFKLTNEECSADFKLGGSHIKFSTINRMPWSRSNIYSAGPEGWLGYTSLLPCHYFVHSVGSDCTYSLSLPTHNEKRGSNGGQSDVKGNQNRSLLPDETVRNILCTGTGYSHIEGNHGSFFPSGWVWSQSISPVNNASFSLTGGKFEIGILAPVTFILFVRTGRTTKIFRTTGFDAFSYDLDGVTGTAKLTAHSFSGKDRVDLVIQSKSSVSGGSFGAPLYIPTAKGFSNTPGCVETYTADALLTLYERDKSASEYIEKERLTFPLTAFEFGGSFQGAKLHSEKQKQKQSDISHSERSTL
jgi:hypothetical protein